MATADQTTMAAHNGSTRLHEIPRVTPLHVRNHRTNGHSSADEHSAKPSKLRFSAQFQTDVLRLCLEDPAWLSVLRPVLFDDPLEGHAFRQMQAIHRVTNRRVTPKALYDAMLRRYGKPTAKRI